MSISKQKSFIYRPYFQGRFWQYPLINYPNEDGNQSELREACNRNDSLLEDLGETPTNFSMSKEATPTSGKIPIFIDLLSFSCEWFYVSNFEYWNKLQRTRVKDGWIILKCGFLKKSFIMNAPLVSCQFPAITFGLWVGATANPPKSDDWKWELTRGAFIINGFLRNSHFSFFLYTVHAPLLNTRSLYILNPIIEAQKTFFQGIF